MKLWPLIALGVTASAGLLAGIVVQAPWSPSPQLYYEAVSGYPMKVYFRNIGEPIVEVVAAGGFPVLVDAPLSKERIDAYLAVVRSNVKPGKSMVKSGEFVRFEVDDPDGLVWQPAKVEHTTWFYLFAIIETPRAALMNKRWVNELCLVSKTNEPFTRCPTHNEFIAGSS